MREVTRPNWFHVYRGIAWTFNPNANDLVLVTRESARIGASALSREIEKEAYHTAIAAENELRAASQSVPTKTHFDALIIEENAK